MSKELKEWQKKKYHNILIPHLDREIKIKPIKYMCFYCNKILEKLNKDYMKCRKCDRLYYIKQREENESKM